MPPVDLLTLSPRLYKGQDLKASFHYNMLNAPGATRRSMPKGPAATGRRRGEPDRERRRLADRLRLWLARRRSPRFRSDLSDFLSDFLSDALSDALSRLPPLLLSLRRSLSLLLRLSLSRSFSLLDLRSLLGLESLESFPSLSFERDLCPAKTGSGTTAASGVLGLASGAAPSPATAPALPLKEPFCCACSDGDDRLAATPAIPVGLGSVTGAGFPSGTGFTTGADAGSAAAAAGAEEAAAGAFALRWEAPFSWAPPAPVLSGPMADAPQAALQSHFGLHATIEKASKIRLEC